MATEQTWVPLREQGRELLHTAADRSSEPGLESNSARFFVAEALRAEIVEVGRKLWEREYVDGNGGNISARLDGKHLLCTPTKMCKRDMEPGDICVSDLEGNTVSGGRMRTSELLLHLEIYKANPRAQAIVHCHPPYATAFAMTGSAPPVGLISEVESSIGPVAVAPYETPGTQAFAETVLPYVEDHNTILLANHGIVCWADTVTHAEWLVETFETYCKTYLIAQQIGKPLVYIPDNKIEEILRQKRRLNLPDARNTEPGAAARGDEQDGLFKQRFAEWNY